MKELDIKNNGQESSFEKNGECCDKSLTIGVLLG
jgi:hypothetical protein